MILLSILLLASCGSSIKNLTYLYGKKLTTPRGPLFPGSELIIYSDSTFEYTLGGPGVKYARGNWKLNEKHSGLILKSGDYAIQTVKITDTVILHLDEVEVEVINRKSVKLYNKRFSYID